jgi:ribosomal protein S12 methylthiotransferase accessory factor
MTIAEAPARIRLRTDVRINAVDAQNGFLETPAGLQRLRAPKLEAVVTRLLPLLDGTLSEAQLVTAARPWLEPEEVGSLLESLRAQGLLEEPPGPAPDASASPVVVLAGHMPLTAPLARLIEAEAGVEVVAAPGWAERDAAAWEAELQKHPGALVVVAAGSLLDPRAITLNRLSARQGSPCLALGLDAHGQGFVGPLWSPAHLWPCLECLVVRTNANSLQGEVRVSYQQHLVRSGQLPLDQPVSASAATHLALVAARLAERWLPGGSPEETAGQVIWVDLATLASSQHQLLPVPTCRACSRHQRAHRELNRPVGEIEAALDPRVGIVHSLLVRKLGEGTPIHVSQSTSSNLAVVFPGGRVTANGGVGRSEEAARRAGLGESLERYAAAVYFQDELVLAAYRELKEPALEPSSLGLFSRDQYDEPGFPYRPFDEDARVRWTRATEWPSGQPLLVPAVTVHLPYRVLPTEVGISPGISTGLAAGAGLEQAILSGLYEVLERDSLSISWLHRLPPRQLTVDLADSSPVGSLLRRAESEGCRVRLFDLSLELPFPVIMALIEHGRPPEQVLAIGCACRLTTAAAAEKALLEANQGISYLPYLLEQYRDWEPAPDFSNVDDFHKHAILYSRRPELRDEVGYVLRPDGHLPERRPAQRSVLDGAEPLQDVAAELALVTEQLQARGQRVLVVNLTPPDVEQVRVRVVRVIVPGLQHLNGAHKLRFLGNPRLHTVAQELGRSSRPDNPYPHPLP